MGGRPIAHAGMVMCGCVKPVCGRSMYARSGMPSPTGGHGDAQQTAGTCAHMSNSHHMHRRQSSRKGYTTHSAAVINTYGRCAHARQRPSAKGHLFQVGMWLLGFVERRQHLFRVLHDELERTILQIGHCRIKEDRANSRELGEMSKPKLVW